jgi:hypothetical protein
MQGNVKPVLIRSLFTKFPSVLFSFFRVKKLDWAQIEFDDLSGEDCQKCWNNIQGKIRHYRVLQELVQGRNDPILPQKV